MTERDKIKEKLVNGVIAANVGKVNLPIDPKIAKRVYAYFYINTDIKFLLQSATKLQSLLKQNNPNENEERFDQDALWYGIIAIYGRCFTSNSGNASLKEKDVFKGNEEMLELHLEIMRLRHKFIAHREETEFEVGVMVLSIDRIFRDGRLEASLHTPFQRKSIHPQELDDYLRLFTFVGEYAMSVLMKRCDHLLSFIQIKSGVPPTEEDILNIFLTHRDEL